MGRWRVGSVGKRKSMHPTPSEQRPFVYLMKRTTRRTFPSLLSRAPFLPSYASIPLFPSDATGQTLRSPNFPTSLSLAGSSP